MQQPQKYYIEHRKRLRQKACEIGLKNLADYEILEYLLTFAIARKDVKPIAKDMIKTFGSLKQALDAKKEDLRKIKGIKDYCASFISFIREFAGIYAYLNINENAELSSPSAVNEYLLALLGGQSIEKIQLLFLNSANKIIGDCEIESGTINKSVVQPRKFIEKAIQKGAASVIMAHNHPGGSLRPSQNDIETTKTLKTSFETVEIDFLDHIIISGKDYFSFKEHGLL